MASKVWKITLGLCSWLLDDGSLILEEMKDKLVKMERMKIWKSSWKGRVDEVICDGSRGRATEQRRLEDKTT